jgi:hypothetical protein
MDFKFECPHCDQPLEVSSELLGEKIECSACTGRIALPDPQPAQNEEEKPRRMRVSRSSRVKPHSTSAPKNDVAQRSQWSRRIVVTGLSALALILAGAYLLSPYWSSKRMLQALADQDAAYVADHVDFPKLRESVKSMLKARILEELENDESGISVLGTALAAMMIDPFVDAMISPEGLIAMMSNKDSTGGAEGDGRADLIYDRDSTYEGLNRFVLTLDPMDGDAAEKKSFVFTRAGIWSWKLSGMRLEKGALPSLNEGGTRAGFSRFDLNTTEPPTNSPAVPSERAKAEAYSALLTSLKRIEQAKTDPHRIEKALNALREFQKNYPSYKSDRIEQRIKILEMYK